MDDVTVIVLVTRLFVSCFAPCIVGQTNERKLQVMHETICRSVLRKRLFMTVYTIGLYITDALAIRAGTSASPADRTLFPLKILVRLTREYGDQLSMKAVIATAVRRSSFICQCRLLSLIRLSSVTTSRRKSLLTQRNKQRKREQNYQLLTPALR